jgi:integrase
MVAIGKLERDPTTDLRGALKSPQTKNRAAVTDISLIPKLLRDIQNYSGEPNTVYGLKLSALVFVRPIELRGALWADIDFDNAEWKYTPTKTRNQTKLDHIVSLSKKGLEILRELYELNGHTPYVFYSSKAIKHKIMSENTINQALRRMGYSGDEMCAHGFRALAKTTLKERLKFSDEETELQLAHRIKNIHGTAYDRTAFLDERKAMMQVWADYLDELRGGQMVPFPKVAG